MANPNDWPSHDAIFEIPAGYPPPPDQGQFVQQQQPMQYPGQPAPQLYPQQPMQPQPPLPHHQQQQQHQYPPQFGQNSFMFAAAADPVMAAAMSGASSYVNTSSSWIDRNLRPLFAVDDAYVLLKLSFLLFPFRRWQHSISKPDLYIPLMSFITYVLGAGYLLGLKNQFTPEKLGMISSSALFCMSLEVALMAILYAIFNTGVSLLTCIAFSGYKFVATLAALAVGCIFDHTGYYIALAYLTLSLGYYLVRSTHMEMAEKSTHHETNRRGLYMSAVFCLLQPLIILWLSSHLLPKSI